MNIKSMPENSFMESKRKFKKKPIIKLNPWHKDFEGASIGYRLRMIKSQIRMAIQRMLYGYDDIELWNMDEIFVAKYKRMLRNLRATLSGHPATLTEAQWNKILDRMIELLEIMGKDDYGEDGFSEQTFKEKDTAKNQFFRLMSVWFWDLWD